MLLRRAALALGAALLAAGCQNGDAPAGYFPLAEGLGWRYQVINATPLRREEGELRIVNLGRQTLDGETYWVRRTDTGNRYYLQQRHDGIVRAAWQTAADAQLNKDREQRYVVKLPAQAGARWKYHQQTYLLKRASSAEDLEQRRYLAEWKVLATDATVETPAGAYENCLHIRGRGVAIVYRRLSTVTDRVTLTTDEWYAPEVGLVKLTHTEKPDHKNYLHGGEVTMALLEFEQ